MTTSGSARERGGCLTIYLVLIILGSFLGLAGALTLNSTAAQLRAQGLEYTIPSWYAPATVLPILLTLAGAYGTWTWKKWGIYLLGASLVVSFLIGAAAGQIASGAIGLIIGGALLWYVLRGKWQLFEG